jgi:glycosyltransferase involved in cell wall biosynthesis
MLEHHLVGSAATWGRQLRPMVLAIFSYRYDAELVPDLLANVSPAVDGWVAFDDRAAGDLFSSEPRRRRLLIERAKELGATWVLAIDPDERIERGAATRIRGLTCERHRIIWEFNLREMFTADTYRIDGIWGSKFQGRLFPVFDGPLCSDQPLHGAWCIPQSGYSVCPAGLNLYHLKMISSWRRRARRDLYEYLDPIHGCQTVGYDYLVDESDARFEQIPVGRDFFPAHRESDGAGLYMPDVRPGADRSADNTHAAIRIPSDTPRCRAPMQGTTVASQLGQLQISVGEQARRDSRLAAVVIGLRAPKSLYDAVRSLVQQDTPSEIIVVNSGGGDAASVLGEYLRSVVLVELREPVLVGAARNIGIQISHAPFVAFLAGDCVAAPGWVSERTGAHENGEGAVASVIENDKPHNPFAWAAHLVTYGHRMAGSGGEGGAYGASYDRAFFDKYGYFSETRIIGEDSDFHSRFRQSDIIFLHDSIRTIHSNPGDLISFLEDQLRRGLKRRYLTDFFGLAFSLGFIGLETVGRVARVVRLSSMRLRGRDRLLAIASWPFLLLGALFHFIGMAVSYVSAIVAERRFRRARDMMLWRRFDEATRLLQRAIDLRPATARYHLALADLLKHRGDYDQSARQFYAGWDIERTSIIDVYPVNQPASGSNADTRARLSSVSLQLVIFADSSKRRLAELLATISAQRAEAGNLDVLLVEGAGLARVPRQLRKLYAHDVKFVSPHRLLSDLTNVDSHHDTSDRSFVVLSSGSCALPRDWLPILRAYIVTYPEIELFHGHCQPCAATRASFMERLGMDLGLFPNAANNGGLLHFTHGANWAFDRSLLSRSGWFTDKSAKMLGDLTLAERLLRIGGSSLFAGEWQTCFQVETSFLRMLRGFCRDGHLAARHFAITKGSAGSNDSVCGLGGTTATVWQFASDNFRTWRLAKRSAFLYAPAFLLLLLIALSRQIGWLAGRMRFGDDRLS